MKSTLSNFMQGFKVLFWQSFITVLGFYEKGHRKSDIKNPTEPFSLRFKPSLSMKILSINNFTTKVISDLSIGVHFKGTYLEVCY